MSYIYYLYKFCNVYLHFFSILIGITILARNEQRELLPPFLFCAYIVEIIVFATGLRRSHFAPVLPPFSFPPSCFASCLVSPPSERNWCLCLPPASTAQNTLLTAPPIIERRLLIGPRRRRHFCFWQWFPLVRVIKHRRWKNAPVCAKKKRDKQRRFNHTSRQQIKFFKIFTFLMAIEYNIA